MFLVYKLFVIL